MDGLVFRDNHGIQCSNHVDTPVLEASLNEWHYDKFGIMRQHYSGKEDNADFRVMHEVRPALMFSIATNGFGVKNVYSGEGRSQELLWRTGDANLYFISGEGGLNVNLSRDLSLDILSIVIPQQFIENLVGYNAQTFESLSVFTHCHDNTHVFLNENRPMEKAVIRAANDIGQAHLMGRNAYRYMESKIIDCFSGFLDPDSLSPGSGYYSLLIRDKMHDAKDLILSHYQDMPSLHDLAVQVGTNECTLKKAFKQEFGTTVFQYLFDYRMDLAIRYLLDTSLPIAEVGARLGLRLSQPFLHGFQAEV